MGERAGAPAPRAGGVRRAAPRDLLRLAALWGRFLDHHAEIEPHYRRRADSDAPIREMLRGELSRQDRAVFVWDDGGDLLGFCSARVDRAPPILEETERAEITDVFVREGARRCGLGRALALAALAWVAGRGVSRVELRVASRNPAAQAFWRALGFDDLMDVLHRRL